MSSLPIPIFTSVKEVHSVDDSVVLIVPYFAAGKKHRYNVIRIYHSGATFTIGRELPIKVSRIVANRPSSEDGKPLK